MTDTDRSVLEKVTIGLVDALNRIDEGQRSLPTPCAEWNLADLIDHVTGGNWYTIRVLAGDASADALTAAMAKFDNGSASIPAAVQSATDQLEAFSGAGVLDRSLEHVAGELSGRQILRLRVHDLIVHTWDINESIQPPASIPAELADWGLRELQDPDSPMAKHFGIPDSTGSQPPCSDAASEYLHAFGRS